MTAVCQQCLAGQEPPVRNSANDKIPDGCCVVCWIRYGKFTPVCRTLEELKKEKKNEN